MSAPLKHPEPTWSLKSTLDGRSYPPLEVRYRCDLGGTLEVVHEGAFLSPQQVCAQPRGFGALARSGVWRYRSWVLPLPKESVVTRDEGNTNLYDPPTLARYVGLDQLLLKHEGENPTGSFKDRGMTTAISVAKHLGLSRVACASTGNTSASMASYAASAGMEAFVFIPAGEIAYGKLSQAMAYGAKTLALEGDFDDAMRLVETVCHREGVYLLNSINPYRIEGQKSIGFELLEDLGWSPPDWIVLPGGNLGNNTAIVKGLLELKTRGLIDRVPRVAVVQAEGADPLYQAFLSGAPLVPIKAKTIATAIQIGAPVSWVKSMRGLEACRGVVTSVSDQALMDAKAEVDRSGVGAEPASCATVAGIKRLVSEGVINVGERVVGILTGHVLKDPEVVIRYHQGTLPMIQNHLARPPIPCEPTVEAVLKAMG